MQRLLLVVAIMISGIAASAQHIFKAKIINHESGEPLAGATVSIEALKKNAIADFLGKIIIYDMSDL